MKETWQKTPSGLFKLQWRIIGGLFSQKTVSTSLKNCQYYMTVQTI